MSSDYAAQVKKVGLLSLVDLEPNISYLTTSAQESFFSRATLPGWDADAIVQRVLGGNLKRRRFEVIPIARSAELLAVYESDWSYPRVEAIHADLYARGAELGLDVIVVVCRHVEADLATKTNQKLRGYGLQKAFDTGPFAYAAVYVEALDIKKQFVVGRADGFQVAPLPETAWSSEFEHTRGTLPIAESARATIVELLSRIFGDAVAVAAQEAGV
jgi:hypothetical protein